MCFPFDGEEAKFLSTPSGWRATVALSEQRGHGVISIHALRVEGDQAIDTYGSRAQEISIHALRVEGDTGHGGA